ncbi:helix-turn-helix domain-containing protein [Patescibacteria group bacterium]|nr:helix-turn-helix domain-containing protein [Patescibacteria group bacterium]
MFKTKKVGGLTLAEKLAEMRKKYNLGMDFISDKTKIPKKYLAYLEEERFDKLPAEVYVKGFLKKIAEFYELDPKSFVLLYEKEEGIRKNIDKGRFPALNLAKNPTFIITPKKITLFAISIILILFSSFLAYHVSSVFKGPQLIIDSPLDNSVVESAPILVSGEVKDSAAQVSINGQIIGLKEDGKISQYVNLSPGLNKITISAVNRFKKSNVVVRNVILKEESGQ